MESSLPQLLAVYAIPVLLAITLHEAAHGYAARALGDPTAWRLGRVTANPVRHIDPVGTLLVPGLILLASKAMGGVALFGWAKPVPVDVRNLRSPRRDMALIAAAGPLANVAMATAWALAAQALAWAGIDRFFVQMAVAGVVVNVGLAVLNLIPIPPLDGGRILVGVLPERPAGWLARVEPFGLAILLALLATGLLTDITGPLVSLGVQAIAALTDPT